MKVSVHLHNNRRVPGILQITPETSGNETARTFRCLGLSDQAAATAHSNPSRSPVLHEGDLPTGEYLAVKTHPAAPATPENVRSFGPGIRFVLNPVSGQASEALLNGRYGLMIHGGPTGAPMPVDALRPTHGCLRVDDSTIEFLATLGASFAVTVAEDLKD